MKHSLRFCVHCMSLLALYVAPSTVRAQWTPPTEEELKMTSQPEVPGAAAVYLYREEITEDKLHMWSVYVRMKVLTERGKEQATVELRQYKASDDGGYSVGDIQGRTIHPDGTMIAFTGKPFEKLIEKGQGYKAMAKVFTLPGVDVGSIIEYRYKVRYDDHIFIHPDWYIQSEFYTRKGHYIWKPTDEQLISKNDRGEQLTSVVAWTPVLPPGVMLTQTRLPGATMGGGQLVLELNVHDIPPFPDEENMPPLRSLSYRVLFYYSPYKSSDEYWKNEGKGWSKQQDKFIGPGPKVRAAVQELVAASDTPDQKLRKIYAAVMQVDNSAFSRTRSAGEEKSQGLGEAKNTDDIWERKRGSDDQITDLFIAMARAANIKSYPMAVTDRDRGIFLASYLSFGQFDDLIAIVNIDGKDQFLDPGQRFSPYQHLAWKHTQVQGIRQLDGSTALATTPLEPYTASRTQRTAELTLDDHGQVTGNVTMTWTGAPALRWRQTGLRGDSTSLEHDLRTSVEQMMPGNMEVKVSSIENETDYEKPLAVHFNIKGFIASSTGKRLLIPNDIFEVNERPTFPHEKRSMPIYFQYPEIIQDAVRIKFPPSLGIESLPASEKLPYEKYAAYSLNAESTSNSVTVRRDFLFGNILYATEEYAGLRGFYNKLETKDHEPIVLKTAAVSSGN